MVELQIIGKIMTTVTITAGTQDTITGNLRGANADTWSSLSTSPYATWANWHHWATNPQTLQLRFDDDLGSIKLRAPTLSFNNLQGSISSISLKISSTGVFGGEETTYTFSLGTDVEVIAGQYYRWTISVTGTAPYAAEVSEFTIEYVDDLETVYLQNILTSTLQSSSGYRIVDHDLGSIDTCIITAHDTYSWVDRAYALPDDWSETTITPIPGIISKSPLTIVLRDHFGVEVDGRVDILIRGIRPITLTATGVVLT